MTRSIREIARPERRTQKNAWRSGRLKTFAKRFGSRSKTVTGTVASIATAITTLSAFMFVWDYSVVLVAALCVVFLRSTMKFRVFVACATALAVVFFDTVSAISRAIDANAPELVLVLSAISAVALRLSGRLLPAPSPLANGMPAKLRDRATHLMPLATAIMILVLAFFLLVRGTSIPALIALIVMLLCGLPRCNGHILLRSATNVAVLIVSTTFAFAILETGLRLAIDTNASAGKLHQYHRQYLYLLRPGMVTTYRFAATPTETRRIDVRVSEQGLRNTIVPPKVEGEYRVALIGDSFTYGLTVNDDQTIAAYLQRDLQRKSPSVNVTCINGGLHGSAPWQQKGMLVERLLDLQPDILLHQLFLGNDIDDTLHKDGRHLDAHILNWTIARLRWYRHELPQYRIDAWLRRNIHAYRLMSNAVDPRRRDRFLDSGLRIFPEFTRAEITHSADRAPWLETDLVHWYPTLQDGWSMYLEDIETIQHICESHAIAYAAYVVPVRQQVLDDEWREALERTTAPYERYKGIQRLETDLQSRGITFIRAHRAVLDHPRPESLYFEVDAHLRPAGNRLYASQLCRFLHDTWSPESLHRRPLRGE